MFPTIYGVASQGGRSGQAGGGGGGTVEVAEAVAAVETASGTTLNVPLSEDIESGDAIYLAVWGRSALTTPAGYTLEFTSATQASFSGRFAVFRKTADGTEAGATLQVQQASSGRLQAAHAVLRGSGGSPTTESAQGSAASDTSKPFELVEVANPGAGRLGLAIYASEFAATSGPYTLTGPDGYTLVGNAATTRRLALAYKLLEDGEAIEGSFTNTLADPSDVVTGSFLIRSE